jgi:hypothetical protein
MKLLGIISVGFDINQLLIRYWRRKLEYNEAVHQLCVGIKKVHDSVRRTALYNILIQLGVPMKLVRLMAMCLNETYSKVCTGKHLSDNFPIQNGLKQGDVLLPLVFNFPLENVIRKVQKNQVRLN